MVVGEDLPCECGVAFEAVVAYGRGGVVGGAGVGGFFPVAFAVPQVAGLVLLPKRVGFCPHTVVEAHMLFARCGTAAGQPAQVWE